MLKAVAVLLVGLAACAQEEDFVLSPFEPLYCDAGDVETLHWIALGDFPASGDVVERTHVGADRALDAFPHDTREVAVRAYDAAGILVAVGRSPSGGLADRRASISLLPVGAPCGSGSGLGEGRRSPRVVADGDGGAMVLAGLGRSEESALVERLDPETAEILAAPSLGRHRAGHTATLVSGGRVLVAGGEERGRVLSEAELYDPDVGVLETSEMTQARSGHAAASVPGGVLVCGGTDERGPVAGADLYDPSSGRWSATGSLARARSDHALVARGDDALVLGGVDADGAPVVEVERWDPGARTFEATGGEASLGRAVAAASPSGAVVAVGEAGAVLVTPSGEVRALDPPFAAGTRPDVALALADGTVAFFGGGQGVRYAAGEWSALPALGEGIGAAVLADGSVLAAGGTVGADPSAAFALVRFDVASDYSTPASPLGLGEPLDGIDVADPALWRWVAAGLSSGLEGDAGALAAVTIGRYTAFELRFKVGGRGSGFVGFSGEEPACQFDVDQSPAALVPESCTARTSDLSRIVFGVEEGTLRFRELTARRL